MVPDACLYSFDTFLLDAPNRRLYKDGQPVELIGRYFDALLLLVREQGQLVGKDRFFEEVWSGMVVSDSALTQCIKEIRKQLGDDVASPRYVQTVPRYGYRFLGEVKRVDRPSFPAGDEIRSAQAPDAEGARTGKGPLPIGSVVLQGLAATLGGGSAGSLGGLIYGCAQVYAADGSDMGGASMLLVFIGIGVLLGLVGGAGIGLGMAAGGLMPRRRALWSILGAALGGLLVGGVAKVLGVDAFQMLLGHAPVQVTGALEGAALGTALALGAFFGGGVRASAPWRPVLGAAAMGAVAGVLIPLAGGHLLFGSLALLARAFPDTHLHLDALGAVFGESGLGIITEAVLGGIEGLLFGACVVGGLVWAKRVRSSSR
jgi:DNA-binding winged helix-turn-helix (wHTH) protein